MRKTILTLAFLAILFPLFAQSDITTFLGIPVDGYKHEMIQKLKAKGVVSSGYDSNILEGEFNGTDVNVHIVTNNNKVYRIALADKNLISETDIRIRFNNLCIQFKDNTRYLSLDDYIIPEDEDISYGMTVKNKRYQASFCQAPNMQDTVAIRRNLYSRLSAKYTEEQFNNPTEDIAEELAEDIIKASASYAMEVASMKSVWFMIAEHYGEYYIMMFYDNGYNKASGDDL